MKTKNTKTRHGRRLLPGAALALGLLATACSDSKSDPRPVSVTFAGLVHGDPFSCTTTYAGVGTAATAEGQVLTPQDFRFYVHDVRLVRPDGVEVPIALTEDGVWQHAGVALLDFEDGTGTCNAQGNAGTNSKVVGTVPDDTYAGLKFRVGVPYALNHLQVATQPSPLNLSAMYWTWTSGYRFVRIEGTLAGATLHLGSAGCTLVDAADPTKGSNCTNPNRFEVSLPAFDVGRDRVVLDLADLWDGTDLTTTAAPARGCMSGPTDPDCAPVFPKLGLPYGTYPGGAQTVFKKG